MPVRITLVLLLNAFSILLVLCQSDSRHLRIISSINPLEVYSHTKTLTNDFNGRLTGDSGYTKSAQWVASKFRSWKLKSFDKFGYLQSFPVSYTIVQNADMIITLPALTDTSKEQTLKLERGKDFIPMLFSDSGENNGNFVFAGWGICAPEYNYDDYYELDVKNKFVLCFRGTPKDDSLFTKFDEHRTRMLTAKQKGALGIFYIYEELIANPNGELIPGFNPAIISYNLSDRILAEKGWTTKSLLDSLKSKKRPISFPLKASAKFKVNSKHHPNGIGYNVIGFIEGSDARLKKECIVVGAHLDHCGTHMGLTFPGANDNASGSAVVMEIAKAISQSKKTPKRSVVFVLFGGEEMGLIGSKHFVNHLPKQISSVKAMINFDMVGTGDGAWCGYSEEPDWVKSALDNANSVLNVVKGSRPIKKIGVRSSDFASFYKKGIPFLTFASNGPHLFYHQTGDTIYRINPDILADIARLGLLCALYIANL